MWTSLNPCGMSAYPKLGFCILGSDSRGSYHLPTHSTFSLTHFPSFYVNLVPNPPPVPLAHSCISHGMESRVIAAVSFPQPHKLRPLDRKGSMCAFALSVFGFFGLCPLSLSLSPGFSHCLMIVSSSVNMLPDRPHPLMACSLHRMIDEND